MQWLLEEVVIKKNASSLERKFTDHNQRLDLHVQFGIIKFRLYLNVVNLYAPTTSISITTTPFTLVQ